MPYNIYIFWFYFFYKVSQNWEKFPQFPQPKVKCLVFSYKIVKNTAIQPKKKERKKKSKSELLRSWTQSQVQYSWLTSLINWQNYWSFSVSVSLMIWWKKMYKHILNLEEKNVCDLCAMLQNESRGQFKKLQGWELLKCCCFKLTCSLPSLSEAQQAYDSRCQFLSHRELFVLDATK